MTILTATKLLSLSFLLLLSLNEMLRYLVLVLKLDWVMVVDIQ